MGYDEIGSAVPRGDQTTQLTSHGLKFEKITINPSLMHKIRSETVNVLQVSAVFLFITFPGPFY